MFDTRNKSQPTLVYAKYLNKDLKSEQAQPGNISAKGTDGNKTQETQRNVTNAGQPSQQYQQEGRQKIDTHRQSPQKQPQKFTFDLSSSKQEEALKDFVVQTNGTNFVGPPSVGINIDRFRKVPQETSNLVNYKDNNVNIEQNKEFKLYRGQNYEGNKDRAKIQENMQTTAATSMSNGKITIPPPIPSRQASVSSSVISDSSQANFLRHPRTQSPVQMRSKSYQQSPKQLAQQQHHLYLQQQLHLKQQQQQQLKQQQQIPRDHSYPNDDPRYRPQVIRVRSYPVGRQQVPANLDSTSNKQGNVVQPFHMPRVSTSASGRPHSLTLPVTRNYDGTSGSFPTHKDFSNYNPSASPRALRSHSTHHYDIVPGQASPSPSSLSPSTSNPPKSILKNNLSLEQSDLFFSSRPLVLPRAHSDKNSNYVARDFDFSSILTTNKDPYSAKITTIQVKGQVHGQTSSPKIPRPASVGSNITQSEGSQEGRPIRKSVTFNSLVRLHHEDEVPSVRPLPVDA